ncbi:hypothetical protein J2X47_004239 [Sphingomonas sp. BE270]|jgi:hypothetical protein|uniref:hypothetical protein n=1 Tax=Sphingomonas sp. BE270 TaxID=2817726 RepID=UPI0028578D38|nr:hypothetical protein [Sphingomonas sp. BE270]MDR7260031.1 hypothetical protein [Sphingomonas sp. BE270]
MATVIERFIIILSPTLGFGERSRSRLALTNEKAVAQLSLDQRSLLRGIDLGRTIEPVSASAPLWLGHCRRYALAAGHDKIAHLHADRHRENWYGGKRHVGGQIVVLGEPITSYSRDMSLAQNQPHRLWKAGEAGGLQAGGAEDEQALCSPQ